MPKNIRNKWVNWSVGITLGLAGAAAHAHTIYDSVGSASQVGLYATSTHGASQSVGGSVFSGGKRQGCFPEGGGLYSCSTLKHTRSFTCASGTACANALCGAGKSVSAGSSWSTGSSSHGGKGGHPATVSSYTCL